MKIYLVALSVLSLGSLWLSAANAKPIPTHRGAFAVVELFTSEGCSSCPPAERVTNELHQKHSAADDRVFVLSFHVDYWNRLGWADPFSDAAYSDRQRRYADAFNNRSIYTPQMVINGQSEFVGSRATQARDEVRQALAPDQPAEVGVGLALRHDTTAQTLGIDWRLDRDVTDAVLHLAVTQDGLTTDVPRGENRGKTLTHDGVVRVFRTVPLNETHGSINLELPPELDAEQAAVVGFVQAKDTMRILGAHRVDLASP